MIDDVHNANGLFLISYTNDSSNVQPAVAYNSFVRFFEPDYITGQNPPVNFVYWPFNVVIDLETMVVLARGPDVTMQQIRNLVNQANN